MTLLERVAAAYSGRSRAKRAELFRAELRPARGDRILDLGSEDGSHLASILDFAEGVYIADVAPEPLQQGRERFGFTPVLIGEDGRLPFQDGYFDVVFCSSTIEHVTVDKSDVHRVGSGGQFARAALERQRRLASEIRRVGRRYFVQTPYRFFPIESHTWLPGVAFLPRPLQVRLIRFLNRFWPKKTSPDWHLLTKRQMRELFPDADLVEERSFGLTKSLIAIRQ